MANQGSDNLHSSINVPGQAQMIREDWLNEPSDMHNQNHGQGQGQASNLLQETGTQVKNMAQGAAGSAVNMAQGAAGSAVNMARGAASSAANIAQGAADAVKNTLGMNPSHNTTDTYLNHPGTINFDDDFPNSTTTIPGGTTYPNNPRNPSAGI